MEIYRAVIINNKNLKNFFFYKWQVSILPLFRLMESDDTIYEVARASDLFTRVFTTSTWRRWSHKWRFLGFIILSIPLRGIIRHKMSVFSTPLYAPSSPRSLTFPLILPYKIAPPVLWPTTISKYLYVLYSIGDMSHAWLSILSAHDMTKLGQSFLEGISF